MLDVLPLGSPEISYHISGMASDILRYLKGHFSGYVFPVLFSNSEARPFLAESWKGLSFFWTFRAVQKLTSAIQGPRAGSAGSRQQNTDAGILSAFHS